MHESDGRWSKTAAMFRFAQSSSEEWPYLTEDTWHENLERPTRLKLVLYRISIHALKMRISSSNPRRRVYVAREEVFGPRRQLLVALVQ